MKYLFSRFLILALITTQAASLYAASVNSPPSREHSYYDELYDGTDLREIYAPLSSFISACDQNQDQRQQYEEDFLKSSKIAFQGDNSLDPMPRILSPQEAAKLQSGVRQRAQALREFLKDHYSGERLYAKSGIIPEDIVKQIIDRAGETKFDGKINPQTISFMYGPDIIRDSSGDWRVIEDNPGFIGGVGDLKLAYDLMLEKHKVLTDKYELADPMKFYQTLAKEYRKKAFLNQGKAIIYMPVSEVDKEDKRIEEIFASEGIETISPDSKKKLIINDDGVFLKSGRSTEETQGKVGYIFLNGEHSWLRKPLLNSILENKVGSNYSAGIDFIGDKEFYVYVEDLIRFYLREEPILKNIPTQKFFDFRAGQLRSELIQAVKENKDDFVIKRVDGRGGDSVWVGAKTPQSEINKVLGEVQRDPSEYIAQKYMHLSVLGGNIVDLRSISAVFADKIIVAETPWGRGLPLGGNGKVNLSDKGREVTVLVVKKTLQPSTLRCEQVLLKVAK